MVPANWLALARCVDTAFTFAWFNNLKFLNCRIVRQPRNHARLNYMIKENPVIPINLQTKFTPHILQLLARLDAGEVLEKDRGRYRIRRDPVSKRLAKRSIEEGWVGAPPDLFNLTGGRITELGRDVLLSNGGLADV